MFERLFKRKKSVLGIAFMMLCVASIVNADFFDDFETRALGVYAPQTNAWREYLGTPGVFESPMVTADGNSLSGTKCLSNQNDPALCQEEGTVLLESDPTSGVPIWGQDVHIRFMFMRTVEQGDSPNKIRLDVYDTSGERFAIGIYSRRVYNENNNYNMIENVNVGEWYWFDLLLAWDAESDSYGNSAFLQVWNEDKVHLFAQAIMLTNGNDLLNVNKIQLMMRSGATGGTLLPRPTCYVDDLEAPLTDSGPVLPVCGDPAHPYPTADLNLDCYVNFADIAIIAQHWLNCTDPNAPCNYNP
ncbi:MAG: hypothetical protein ACYC54_14355 [Sedimentisphaerales bacterium]